MTDLDGLLHAVLDYPADDAVRLIYADALEESGVAVNLARAEFIRLQIAGEGEDRQRELLQQWLAAWFDRAATPAESGWWAVGEKGEQTSFQFRVTRGFISATATHGDYAGEWTRWTPWQAAEAFADSAVDVFANHPLEQVVLNLNEPEEWWVGANDGSDETPLSRWACYRRPHGPALCRHFSRASFADGLYRAIRDRHFAQGQILWNTRQVYG